MRIEHIQVQGLTAAPDLDLSFDDEAVVALPPTQLAALGDAFDLVRAAVDVLHAEPALVALDLLDADPDLHEISEDGPFLDAVDGLDPDGVEALCGRERERHVVVSLDLTPDPPLFGTLRDRAVHDPRLVTALAGGGDLHVKVGWRFSTTGRHAEITLLAFRVGTERFVTQGAERPPWLSDVARQLGHRLQRMDPETPEDVLAEALHAAATSRDPGRRAAAVRAAEALADEAFGLGTLHVVHSGFDRVRFACGPDLSPLRSHGPGALHAVRLAYTALVDRPDALVVGGPLPEAWRAWLADRATSDGATLEQLFVEAPAS